jgi:hypothetical protein
VPLIPASSGSRMAAASPGDQCPEPGNLGRRAGSRAAAAWPREAATVDSSRAGFSDAAELPSSRRTTRLNGVTGRWQSQKVREIGESFFRLLEGCDRAALVATAP